MANPRTTPLGITEAQTFTLQDRDPLSSDRSSRLIVGLDAPVAETLDFEIWVLNSLDHIEGWKPAAGDRWYRCFISAGLAGGDLVQSRRSVAADAFAGGGRFYLRRTADALTGTRNVSIKATG